MKLLNINKQYMFVIKLRQRTLLPMHLPLIKWCTHEWWINWGQAFRWGRNGNGDMACLRTKLYKHLFVWLFVFVIVRDWTQVSGNSIKQFLSWVLSLAPHWEILGTYSTCISLSLPLRNTHIMSLFWILIPSLCSHCDCVGPSLFLRCWFVVFQIFYTVFWDLFLWW